MAKRFLDCDLNQPYLLPPALQDWLPEGHLARFIAEVTDQLDLTALYATYERQDGRGLAAYHPLMMTRLLLYGYAIGVRSSRALEKATHENVAFRYLSADQHPDHDTIADFRQRHLEALAALFAQALQLCRRAGLVKLGIVAIDGTKVKAQASQRKSMRMNSLRKEEQRLKEVVEELLGQAAQTDAEEEARWGKGKAPQALPAGLERAEQRLQRIQEARRCLEQEAQQALAAAEALPKRSNGRPRKGSPLQPNSESEKRKKAVQRARSAVAGETRHQNLTDPESRMMRDGASGQIVQAYNAQAAVEAQAQIILSCAVTQQVNDRQQLAPMTQAVQRALQAMPEHVVADAGYWNYSHLSDPIFSSTNLLVPPDASGNSNSSVSAHHPIVESMRNKLAAATGRALYAARQGIVEPVFAHIKEQRRFRRFSFRGLAKVQAEWSLVCLTHNLLKLYRSRVPVAA
jgi:transposase